MFSIPFLIYLNIHILYSVPDHSKTLKSLGEITVVTNLLAVSHAGCFLLCFVIFDHELILLGNFSKEIL